MNWIDQVPDEGNARMRANRMALAGHQQMQGQMRDRQRQSNQQHADLVLASQYSGVSRVSGRSPLSEAGQISPHSVSPPVPSPSSFAAMQSKRPPGLNIAANNSQISRLSYGIGASSGVAIGQSDAHAEHRRALLLHEQVTSIIHYICMNITLVIRSHSNNWAYYHTLPNDLLSIVSPLLSSYISAWCRWMQRKTEAQF